ncbi:hypothetical protein BDZ97DRAFT_1610400, partial [Flammula alnicola]
FDIQKKTTGVPGTDDDDELVELAGDMEYEDRVTRERLLEEVDDGNAVPDDDVDGWVDERAALSQAERDVLDKSTHPVKMVLVKIRKLAFKVINLTTLLLPAWKECVHGQNLSEQLIPRDVTTRWNSTYDMLTFVLEYRPVVEKFTAERKNEL